MLEFRESVKGTLWLTRFQGFANLAKALGIPILFENMFKQMQLTSSGVLPVELALEQAETISFQKRSPDSWHDDTFWGCQNQRERHIRYLMTREEICGLHEVYWNTTTSPEPSYHLQAIWHTPLRVQRPLSPRIAPRHPQLEHPSTCRCFPC